MYNDGRRYPAIVAKNNDKKLLQIIVTNINRNIPYVLCKRVSKRHRCDNFNTQITNHNAQRIAIVPAFYDIIKPIALDCISGNNETSIANQGYKKNVKTSLSQVNTKERINCHNENIRLILTLQTLIAREIFLCLCLIFHSPMLEGLCEDIQLEINTGHVCWLWDTLDIFSSQRTLNITMHSDEKWIECLMEKIQYKMEVIKKYVSEDVKLHLIIDIPDAWIVLKLLKHHDIDKRIRCYFYCFPQ